MFELKKVRRNNLLWNWRKLKKIGEEATCPFKIGIKEFDKIWPEHSKISKIFILIGSFRAKYILFELKNCRGIIFHEALKRYIILRGSELSFQNWYKEFDKIWAEHSNSQNVHFNGLLLGKVYIVRAKKITEEQSFMKLEKDKKIGEEATSRFKIGIRNLTKCDPSTPKSQKFSFSEAAFEESIYCLSSKNYREIIFYKTEER